ncbi:unnamed protein product, partial [Tenebrio molitor]
MRSVFNCAIPRSVDLLVDSVTPLGLLPVGFHAHT